MKSKITTREGLMTSLVTFTAVVLLALQAYPAVAQQRAATSTGVILGASNQSLANSRRALLARPDNRTHDVRYQVVPMPLLPGKTNSAFNQRGVNNLGHTTGYSYVAPNTFDTTQAFIWQNGRIRALPLLSGWPSSFGLAINDRDQVAGAANRTDSSGNVRQTAVLWDRGQPINLGTLQPNSQSAALDVNLFGVVVGESFSLDSLLDLPVVWYGGVAHQLPLLAGETQGQALEINTLGVIVGFQWLQDVNEVPCVWYWNGTSYTAVNLGSFGGNYGQGLGINDLAQAVGYSNYAGDEHGPAFTWDFVHGLHILNPLAGDTDANGNGINNSGQIVGMSAQALPDSFTITSVIWQNGIPKDLQTLVPAGTPPLTFGVSNINELGDIALNASDPDGNPIALLLLPTH